jgi:hypothetical protein
MAAPLPLPVNIDSRAATAPGLEVYRAGRHVFRVTFKDGGTASDIGGHTPFMSWSTSAAAVVTSTSAWTVIGASSGLVDFTFSTSALNHASGRYIYEVGVVSNGQPSVYRQGTFIIRDSPFASGANQVLWASNVVWGTFNAINWPFLLPASTNGWDVSGAGLAFTNWLAVSGGNLTLAGTGRSGSNTIGLTTAAIQGAATGAVHGSYLHVNSTAAWVIASITNALNTSIVALNAVSNTPTLQAVGEASAGAIGPRYTNGLRLVEFASGGGENYAARFENTQNALVHTVVKLGAGTLEAAIWASNKVKGVVARIATDDGDGLIIESTLGKAELLSATAPLYIESPTAHMFVRGAHGANNIALDAGRLGNTNRVKLGSLNYALDTTQGNSRIAHVLELNKVTFIGSSAEAFSFKPEYQPADGSVMTYDATKHHWTNQLTINQSSKSDGDVLVYRAAQGEYTNEPSITLSDTNTVFNDATNAAVVAAAAAVALGYESGTSTNHTLWTETHSVSGSIKMLHASVIKSGSDKIAYNPQLGFLNDLDGTNSIRLHERQITDTAGAIVGDWAGPRTFSTVSGLTNNVPNPAAASSNNNAATTKWVRDLVGLQDHSGGGGGGTLATSSQYTATFRHADLAAGVLTVAHGLASTGQIVQVFRTQATGYDEIISPDAVSVSNMNTVLVDLGTFGSFAWTGRVTVAGSSVTAALGNYLQSAQTNGWDVSSGGGIPQWLTNYQFEAVYHSNAWLTLNTDVTNVLQFETETYDLGNIYNPATFTATVIKDGRYEAYVMWGMAHALSASQQMHTFFQTNGFSVGASLHITPSDANSQPLRDQTYRRVLRLTSNSTVRACNLYTSSGTRLGGGNTSDANPLRDHMSMFSMRYLGP